jgi:hypothetical protein
MGFAHVGSETRVQCKQCGGLNLLFDLHSSENYIKSFANSMGVAFKPGCY